MMRTSVHGRRGLAVLAATAMIGGLAGATGTGAAFGQAQDMPPSTSIGPGERSPVTFKKTPLGKGLKKGKKIPKNALVKRQVMPSNVDAGTETAVNAVPPRGQNIVSAVMQTRGSDGRVLRTWNGVVGQGIVSIDSAIEGSAAGIFLDLPLSLEIPDGARIVVFSLFRKGAKNDTD
jgi:hypothetical protein